MTMLQRAFLLFFSTVAVGCVGGPCNPTDPIAVSGTITAIDPSVQSQRVDGEPCQSVSATWTPASGTLRFNGAWRFQAAPSCLRFHGLAVGSRLEATWVETRSGTCSPVTVTLMGGAAACERECETGVRSRPAADASDSDAADTGSGD